MGRVERRGPAPAAAPRTQEAPETKTKTETKTERVAPLSGIGEFEVLSSPSAIGRVDV